MLQFIESIFWELEDTPVAIKKPLKINYLIERTQDSNIESKIIESNLKTPLKWALIAFKTKQNLSNKLIESKLDSKDKTEVLYKELSDKSGYFAKNNIYDKIGFYLPFKELDNLTCKDSNIESKQDNKGLNFPLTYPFAPGTYIELEITDSIESNFVESNQKEKIYTIIFAFSKHKYKPNLNDYHIIIDTSFSLGIKDSKSQKCKTSIAKKDMFENIQCNLKALNKMDNFANLHEAVVFTALCYHTFSNNFNDFRIYPQLSGKIGYIYHTFDIFNKDFVRGIKGEFGGNSEFYERENMYLEGECYLDSIRYDFVNKIVNLYINTYISAFGYIFPKGSEDSKLDLMREFIESLNEMFEISTDFKPQVQIENMDSFWAGSYHMNGNVIKVSRAFATNSGAHEMFRVLVHEYRHFFIHYILHFKGSNEHLESAIGLFLKYCLETKKEHKIIFDSFGDPYMLNPHEKDAYLMEQILNMVIESTFKIKLHTSTFGISQLR